MDDRYLRLQKEACDEIQLVADDSGLEGYRQALEAAYSAGWHDATSAEIEEPSGYMVMHSRMTDTLYFGPFTTLDEVREWLDHHKDVRAAIIPLYRTVDWNRRG